MERLKGVIASVAPVSVKLECVPILLGALFKELGTPMVIHLIKKYVVLPHATHLKWPVLPKSK